MAISEWDTWTGNGGSPAPTRVPPPPSHPPTNGGGKWQDKDKQFVRGTSKVTVEKRQRDQDRAAAQRPTKNRTTHFNRQKSHELHIHINKGDQGGGGISRPGRDGALPGSGFTSDEDIRAFSEAIRRQARPRAVERSLDAETLYSVLRAIPDVAGSLSGSRARARRVSKHLKRIAAAEKLIAKQAAAMYATFCREFEAELSQVSRGRARQAPRAAIWKS